jgi:hypothetical protein
MPIPPFWRWLLGLAPIRLWAIVLVTILALLLPGPVVWVLVYGDWPESTAAQRIAILGFTIYGLMAIALAGQVSNAMVKVHAKTLAGEITVEGDDGPKPRALDAKIEAKSDG